LVAKAALEAQAKLVLNTDTHEPENLFTKESIEETLSSAGLKSDYFNIMQKNSQEIINKRS
jgi:histidinol phosphatase-like PHP family hydrolase